MHVKPFDGSHAALAEKMMEKCVIAKMTNTAGKAAFENRSQVDGFFRTLIRLDILVDGSSWPWLLLVTAFIR